MLNKVIIEGRLTKDPVMEQSYSGTSYCNFSIACERRFANKEDGKHETDFFHLVSWRKTAEFISKYFKKGDPILIIGRLQTRKYTDKNGNNRVATEIIVEEANFTLSKKRNTEYQSNHLGALPSNGKYLPNDDSSDSDGDGDGELPF